MKKYGIIWHNKEDKFLSVYYDIETTTGEPIKVIKFVEEWSKATLNPDLDLVVDLIKTDKLLNAPILVGRTWCTTSDVDDE